MKGEMSSEEIYHCRKCKQYTQDRKDYHRGLCALCKQRDQVVGKENDRGRWK